MILKILKTLFFALGLAMVWLGFFYNYNLAEQPAEGLKATPTPSSGQMETYTLSNDSYSEEAIKELEFRNMENEENALVFRLGDFPESESESEPEAERINAGHFDGEFDALEATAQEPVSKSIPLILALGGMVFLALGFFTFRVEQQKKQTV